jgi:hypothetical protein
MIRRELAPKEIGMVRIRIRQRDRLRPKHCEVVGHESKASMFLKQISLPDFTRGVP